MWKRRNLAQRKGAKLRRGISRSAAIFQVSLFTLLDVHPLCARAVCSAVTMTATIPKPPGMAATIQRPIQNSNRHSQCVGIW